jgi:hypothetical protein
MNRFTQQTLATVNSKHFFMNILCIESFAHKKCTTECCSHLWTCACASATQTVIKLDCAATWWYTYKIYYINYCSFTSILYLFTDSLSYIASDDRMTGK